MEVFHIDIIVDILLRLPAKPLLQFKSVCKSWYNLISSPDFAKLHLQRSSINQSNLHFVFQNPVIRMGDFDTFENAVDLNYPCKNLDAAGGASVVGSCNGLLCLWNHDYDKFVVYLFNPTTRTHKMIPILPRPFHVAHLKYIFIHGFGYESVADDYKFVRILLCSCEETGLLYSELMVYSLNSNMWTKVLDHVPIRADIRRADGVLVNGNLHWVNHTRAPQHPLPIVSFSLSTHRFGEVPVPEVDLSTYALMHVGVLDGSFCILINYFYELEILVMEEYGVVESWTKLIRIARINLSFVVERTIAFTRDRKKLLVADGPFRVASIDLENKVMEDISYFDDPSLRRDVAFLCMENLLMLDDSSEPVEKVIRGGENLRRGRHRTVGEEGVKKEPDDRLLGMV